MGTPLLPPSPRPRAREHGIVIGQLQPGPTNTIVDVPGVRVGHATCWRDAPTVARSGVTAIVPAPLDDLFHRPMTAGTAVLNGAGELTGSIAIAEWGMLECPVLLTGTMALGRVYDAAVDAMLEAVPDAANGIEDVVIAVVGECDDSWLDDARARNVQVADARAALAAASDEAPALGAVGAGTGMITFECKGGIGSASRRVEALDATVGVLLLANYGELAHLTVAGDPVGRRLVADGFATGERETRGSCIVVVATDAPLEARECSRLARRAGLGLARMGSVAHHGSGEIFLAFSTTARAPRRGDWGETITRPALGSWVDELFAATIEATEEAALDALLVADTVVGINGNTAPAFPLDALRLPT
jgi:D-aminopeptidase